MPRSRFAIALLSAPILVLSLVLSALVPAQGQ